MVLALADLIAEQPDRLLPHIHFEGDYCLACDWRRLDLKESAEVMPAISHWAAWHVLCYCCSLRAFPGSVLLADANAGRSESL